MYPFLETALRWLTLTRSSFSETLGRRTIYIVSFSLFVVFSILNAVSVDISMLVVMRILSGGASASVQAVGAGTIADIWEPAHRGRAMGVFYLGPLVGPLCAPIIGGALAQALNWRATMWFLSIYGGVMLLMLLFCLPETLARPPPPPTVPANALQRVSTAQSIKHHTINTAALVKRYLIDPLSVVLYLGHPPVLITVYCASAAFFALFVLNISIQSTFSSPPYSFAPIPLGACYLAPSLGYILASLVGGRWIDHIMAREAKRAGRLDPLGRLVYLPEDRMRENMWLAAAMYPGALVWFGWTAGAGVHFLVPSVANFWFGVGSMLVFGVTTTVLTELMPRRSSSGVAVNNFVRNIFSCVGSVIAQPLIEAVGVGWLCTMVGLFALVTGMAAVWALQRYGPAWREEMDRRLSRGEGPEGE
ncbi:MFS general substrate transporter [Parathielavia hyrcaniae]|uniref:MFS general substrate transporter n=1 Tax=Parathielavia hyrcaniae TaxID=113614 RepID=A0AAN6Q7G4_9PEZI|nr:MFS general substrate transporter [Parathielavia hyrcaniae]